MQNGNSFDEITLPSGQKCPYVEYQFNNVQRLGVIGIDTSEIIGRLEIVFETSVWDIQPVGFINDIRNEFAAQIHASLHGDGWNFVRYGNPFVILLTPKNVNRLKIVGN